MRLLRVHPLTSCASLKSLWFVPPCRYSPLLTGSLDISETLQPSCQSLLGLYTCLIFSYQTHTIRIPQEPEVHLQSYISQTLICTILSYSLMFTLLTCLEMSSCLLIYNNYLVGNG